MLVFSSGIGHIPCDESQPREGHFMGGESRLKKEDPTRYNLLFGIKGQGADWEPKEVHCVWGTEHMGFFHCYKRKDLGHLSYPQSASMFQSVEWQQ